MVPDSNRCIWSPLLFGLAIGFVMNFAVDLGTGLMTIPRRSSRYPAEKLSDFDNADDIALFEETEKDMADTTEAIGKSANKLGLMMSFKKTEIMLIGHNPPPPKKKKRCDCTSW